MANEKRLIDKEKLLEKLTWLAKNEDQFRQTVICGVMHTIAVTPTVDAVEVVHAEWLDGFAVRNGEEVCKSIVCSNCEGVFNVKTFDEQAHYKEVFEWCPFCGAKMDGDGNV